MDPGMGPPRPRVLFSVSHGGALGDWSRVSGHLRVGGASGAVPPEETTERPRRGERPLTSKQDEIRLSSLQDLVWWLSCPLPQYVVCDGRTAALAPYATDASSSSQPGNAQRKPREVASLLSSDWSFLGFQGLLSYPSKGTRGALSTAQPPRSPPSRGPRARPPCRWHGWGGCGTSRPASGEVSAR